MSSWKEYRVKDIAERIGSGATPTSGNDKYYENGIYHWINTGDFNNSLVHNGKQMITEKAINEVKALRFYPKETVLVAMYGASIGKVGLLKVKATVNQACCAIVTKEKLCSSQFLFYSLINNKDSLIRESFGGTQPNVSQAIVSNLSLKVPSLSEQQQIVDYLDAKLVAIDNRVRVLEKQQDAYTRLKKSIIHHAITRGLNPDIPLKDSGIEWIGKIPEHWHMLHLKNCVTINNGKDYKDIEADEGIPVIGSGGIFAYAQEKMYDGEVLMMGRKGTIDKPMYFNGAFWVVDTMFYAIPNKSSCCRYLFYCATLFPYKKISTATALPSMTQTELYQLPIAIPPIYEQQAIANYLDEKCAKIDLALENISKQIEASKRLKKAVINEAISGKAPI